MNAERETMPGTARRRPGHAQAGAANDATRSIARAAEIAALGRRIQARRNQRCITLDVLAERTGLSKGYLSRIENGKKTPPLDTLARIARALGTDINLLLSVEAGTPGGASPFYCVVRAGGRQPVSRPEAVPGYAFERLASADVPLRMQPYLIRLPREFDTIMRSEHEGQEFMYVLHGRVQWELGGELLELGPGDALYLDSRIPHRARALDGDAEALLVVTPRQVPGTKQADLPPVAG